MHASLELHKWLVNVLPKIHSKRIEALSSVVSGALTGEQLTVTALGRSIGGEAKEKHRIKRADRLLSNAKLSFSRPEIYAALMRETIGKNRQPVILVDWSDLDQGQKCFLLRASTPAGGRALTLYEEVHPLSTKEKPKTHRNFLKQLKELLPEGCQPIIVTDAGFRTPWFKQVEELGWHWVGRIRNREQYRLCSEQRLPWQSCKLLYAQATRCAKDLGAVQLTARNEFGCRMVLFKANAKGRQNLTKRGKKPARSIKSRRNAACNREPWLLATSLPVDKFSAKQVVKIYATRMQIEEAFRDLKSARLGLSLEHSGTWKIHRLEILILIGSIAATFAWLLGKATRLAGQHRSFQANSIKCTEVLSAFFLGLRVFKNSVLRIAAQFFELARQQLKMQVQIYAFAY
jgi:hypothetical protein